MTVDDDHLDATGIEAGGIFGTEAVVTSLDEHIREISGEPGPAFWRAVHDYVQACGGQPLKDPTDSNAGALLEREAMRLLQKRLREESSDDDAAESHEGE